MTRAVYVITDRGPGDGGKGGVVHAVAKAQRAHTIIKRGGAQGSHGVRTSMGNAFAFSQWGCGTFEGIRTHLSNQFVVSPEGLLNEAQALRDEAGVTDPFRLLTVDTRALVATPFHGIASRLFELARGKHPRGTIGTGVGQAYRDSIRFPQLALTVGDLRAADLRERLWAVRNQINDYVWPVVLDAEFERADSADVRHELELLADDGFVDFVYRRFREAGRLTHIVPPDYLGDVILPQKGMAVVETSHGVLTDRVYGFHPHTSAIRTLPHITRRLLNDAGYDGTVVNLGVTRAYAIRHGAGPLPTNDPMMAEQLLPGSAKHENRYQGSVRVGPLDFTLLRYALAASGGPNAFDGLAVTWFDQITTNGVWHVSNSYRSPLDDALFTPTGDIRVLPRTSNEHQQALTSALEAAVPIVSALPIDATLDRDELYRTCASVVREATHVPVRMVSFGPTELDKLMK